MERYATKIEDGTVYIEGVEGWMEVGPLATIFDIVGGETYTIQYDREQSIAYDWLQTDDDHTLSFDVEGTIEDMTYPEQFVEELQTKSMETDAGAGVPERTEYFAELMVDIWDGKGSLDHREDNPFE